MMHQIHLAAFGAAVFCTLAAVVFRLFTPKDPPPCPDLTGYISPHLPDPDCFES